MDLRKIGNVIWRIKYWLLLSIVLCLAAAYVYIRYTVPEYRKSISVVLNNQQTQYSDNYQFVSSTLGNGVSVQMDDRQFLLRSTRLMQHVVEKLDLHVRYFSIGRFIEAEQYTDSPVRFSFIPAEGREKSYLNMVVCFTADGQIKIESLLVDGAPVALASDKAAVGQTVDTDAGSFAFAAAGNVKVEKLAGQMRITRSGEEHTAKVLAGNLVMVANPRQPNILTVSITDRHPKRAEDILNTLMEEYNVLAKYYDGQGILNTIAFLDERIELLENELQEVEGNFAAYRSINDLVDIDSQSQIAMSTDKGYKDRLNEMQLQASLLDIIKESVQGEGVHELIPANIGINDGSLNSSIEQYNRMVIDRDRMLAGSSVRNPVVQNATALLNTLKANIQQSVRNLESANALQQQSLMSQLGSNRRQLAAMPSKQLAQTRVSRLQQVKEPLYILLQQKREEALLTFSSLSDHAYIVDDAYGPNEPVSPNQTQIYILAIVLALGVPVCFIILINAFRSRVLFEKDIIERCDIPVLGVVPRAVKNKKRPMKADAITKAGRDPLTESFRMLRSKFQYLNVNKQKDGAFVLLVTSSGPQEGKSFMSVNMALSLAYLDKKVLLVGADLRKPTLARYMELDRRPRGLSDFLAGNVSDIHQIIEHREEVGSLDVITAGPVPVNPGELLSFPLLGDTLDSLRSEYDYIIVDSAPFLMVADSFVLSKSVDSVLYVVRSGFTKLSVLDTLQNMYCEGNFKSIMLVLNSVDFNRNSFFGAGMHGYGYGYGYGYGQKVG